MQLIHPVKRLLALLTATFAVLSLALAGQAVAATTEVVTEADVTRQIEDTPPTDNWVLYTRARPSHPRPRPPLAPS